MAPPPHPALPIDVNYDGPMDPFGALHKKVAWSIDLDLKLGSPSLFETQVSQSSQNPETAAGVALPFVGQGPSAETTGPLDR